MRTKPWDVGVGGSVLRFGLVAVVAACATDALGAERGVVAKEDRAILLDTIEQGLTGDTDVHVPFSFVYDSRPSGELLRQWKRSSRRDKVGRVFFSWTDPATGLRVELVFKRFDDYPAIDWVLHFENTGSADTPIIENIQALDVTINSPLDDRVAYRLHRTNGAPSNPTDFEVAAVVIGPGQSQTMGAGGGRSSNRDFPFFKVESGSGSIIVALGWSGQWKADLTCSDRRLLRITAGMEQTHFKLRPGEKVRSPRILLFARQGDTLESNAVFRQLIYERYTATRNDKKLLPVLYCNTCFTRGGGWLNECNAENQISLINAYAPFGLEALLTDAGWFEGGWPAGAGNWTPRKDAYPEGMGPVAAAAKAKGLIYGLWFEPERVVAGTWLHKNHPEWLLSSKDKPEGTYLLNFGLAEVRDYFFGIVKGFMDLPGFRVYRQDFNMNPLAYWRHSDSPDRQGMTEIRYIEGLYAYWDRIAETWPDSLRIECSSGGRRIDLETVARMHVHQKSDYWFRNEVDQASVWGLSQYLPNHVFMAPINRMDDYSFHSAMATSLCMGWIADAPDFDAARGRELLDRYRAVRHLLIGAWYPLTGYSREPTDWLAVQYHRPDLNEGMVLAFRRADCSQSTIKVTLHGLDATGRYELTHWDGRRVEHTGADLMRGWEITLPEKPRSDLIVYRRK